MARIEPFRAWRPKPELAHKVASPPYDVLSSAEAREMAEGNPLSFLHVVKPEIDLPEGTDVYSDEVYATGRKNLDRLMEQGTLFQEEKPALYIYQLWMGDHVQTGVVAGASVDEYEADLIKKHEHTRKVKEDDRTRHIDTLDANTGPVFLTFRATDRVLRMLDRLTDTVPTYEFIAADGIEHVIWAITDGRSVKALVNAFTEVTELYVADGHHRSAAGVRIRQMRRETNPAHTGEEQYNFFLAVLFPHEEMKILDYNRVVKDLNGLDTETFLEKVGESFELHEECDGRPDQPRQFGMYLDGTWYRLQAREGSFPADDPVASLDVAILQGNLLDPVLGIKDPRSDERIDFVGGIRGLGELKRRVDSGEWAVAFALFPTSIEQLFAVADAGKVMPPKSTWFEPKLRSGLLVRPLQD